MSAKNLDSSSARELVEAAYPGMTIKEAEGNPNMILGWLFYVEGARVYVDFEGDVWDEADWTPIQ